MTKFLKRIDWFFTSFAGLGLVLAGGIVFLIAQIVVSELDPTPKRSNAMSPCQCTVSGPCLITFRPDRAQDLYDDGTHPRDYDRWGQYIGADPEVPAKCRPQGESQ